MESVEPGRRLGRYRIGAEVGRGGMGHVYRAHDEELDRTVAIKVLPPHLTNAPTFVDRFRREARTVAGLRHHGIVAIYDVGFEDGLHYLVMEFLAGRNLADIVAQDGRFEPRRALSLLRQLAAALDYAHAQAVIHRDVKPANVIVSDEGHASLTDFGIAHAAASDRLTMSGGIIGTPAYIAPEQALGRPVDGRADLYSLAVVLYEMLAGRVPFEADSAPAVLLAHAYHTPPAIRDVRPDLSSGIEDVLDRALAKDPSDRFGTGAALSEAVDEALSPSGRAPGPIAASPFDYPTSVDWTPTPGTFVAEGTTVHPGDHPAKVPTAADSPRGGRPGTARWSVRTPKLGKTPAGTRRRRLRWMVLLVVGVVIVQQCFWRYSPFASSTRMDRPPATSSMRKPPEVAPAASPAAAVEQGAPATDPKPGTPAATAATAPVAKAPGSTTAAPVATRAPTAASTATPRPIVLSTATAAPTNAPPTGTPIPATEPTLEPAAAITPTPVAPPILMPGQAPVTPTSPAAARTPTATIAPKPTGPAASPTPPRR